MHRILIAGLLGALLAGVVWTFIPTNPYLGLAVCSMFTVAAITPVPERLFGWRDAIRTAAVVTALLTLFPTARAFVEHAL